jgi:hypothetical protein
LGNHGDWPRCGQWLFFGWIFALHWHLKIRWELYKGFFGKVFSKSLHFWRKNSHKSPYLDVEVMEVARTKQDSQKVLLFCLTSSQIWFINVVDGHRSTYLTKLESEVLVVACNWPSLNTVQYFMFTGEGEEITCTLIWMW